MPFTGNTLMDWFRYGTGAPAPPSNAYVAEDGTTYYVAEDGVTFYVQEH